MSNYLYKRCRNCHVKNKCHVVVQPGSVMCALNRLQSRETHGDEENKGDVRTAGET